MIELNAITKIYNEDVVAVDQLSLTIAPGEVYGLLGPNGAANCSGLALSTKQQQDTNYWKHDE